MRRYAIISTVLLASAASMFAQAGKQIKPKSKAEETAVKALLAAPDADSRIKAADELVTKFADSDFKPAALAASAAAYAEKGNAEKAIFYAEQTLEVDPKNYQSQVLLSKLYAQSIKPTDLDKNEKITKAAKYGNDAIETMKVAEKPNPQLSDADWANVKKDFEGEAHFALGVAAAYQNKMDDANMHFGKVAEMDSDPVDLIRAGRVMLDLKKPALAVPLFEKVAAIPGLPAQIKQIADSDLARAKAAAK